MPDDFREIAEAGRTTAGRVQARLESSSAYAIQPSRSRARRSDLRRGSPSFGATGGSHKAGVSGDPLERTSDHRAASAERLAIETAGCDEVKSPACQSYVVEMARLRLVAMWSQMGSESSVNPFRAVGRRNSLEQSTLPGEQKCSQDRTPSTLELDSPCSPTYGQDIVTWRDHPVCTGRCRPDSSCTPP
jgi:hypothetical protein